MTCGRRPIREFQVKWPNKKARRGLLRAGFGCCDDAYRPVICPTRQVLFENFLETDRSDLRAKRHSMKKPATVLGRGLISPTMHIGR